MNLASNLSASKFNPKTADDLHQWAARRSFDLFASSWEARQHRTHWEITASGWSWNRDFSMRLYSPIVAREYQMKQSQDAIEKAAFQKTLDALHAHDQQNLQQQQAQQQQQSAPRK